MSVPAGQVSKLPSAQLARLETARQAEADRIAAEAAAPVIPGNTPGQGQEVVSTTGVPAATPPNTDTNVVDNVNMTREEANAMRAKAERTATAEGRAETLALELAEAQAALTRAQGGSKDGVSAPASAPASGGESTTLAVDVGSVDISPEDEEAYGDSRKFISALVKKEVGEAVNAALKLVEHRFKAVEQNVTSVSTATARNAHQSFATRVKEAIPAFDSIINHKHWQEYLQSNIPGAGITQQQALANAHHAQNLEDMKVIFDTFGKKYLPAGSDGGYAGVTPSGDSSVPGVSAKPVMLKMSDRRKASDDFIAGRINSADLKVVSDAFTAADKKGLVDYSS